MADQNQTRILYIGDYRYSSWSLRPFMALRQAGIDFTPKLIRLRLADTKAQIMAVSPNGKVPCLHDGDLVISDSLAICEYANDLAPNARLWPQDVALRAKARAIACEMHSGFVPMRQAMSMDITATLPPTAGTNAEVDADVARVIKIWTEALDARASEDGPYLFGHFTIADAMFAPVVSRFRTYGVNPGGKVQTYMDAIFAHPAMVEWIEGARAE